MQLMPATANEVARGIGLPYDRGALTENPQYNIQLGSTFIGKMLNYYDGNYVLAVAAYNAGPGNVNKWMRRIGDPRTPGTDIVAWVENIPIPETRNYVQRVLENLVMYDALYPEKANQSNARPLSSYLGR
jgi:soluble lytic murein transglycosylase